MKVKLEDLTIKQIGYICANNDVCEECPLCEKEYGTCHIDSIVPYHIGNQYKTEVEIDDKLLEEK